MRGLAAIILLALSWCFLMGDVSGPQLLLGALIALVVLLMTRRQLGLTEDFRQLGAIAWWIGMLLLDLVISSLRVAWDIITPGQQSAPRILALPVGDLTPVERVLLANTISLTPGTLSLDTSDDGTVLYIHAMYAEDAEAERRQIL